jgi:hypothetical protein
MSKAFLIHSVARRAENGEVEALEFTEGVNTIVGPKDAGKTVWLRMLDFVLGDPDPPENAFGKLAEKYNSISVEASINGESERFERRWKERNSKGKIFVDDEACTPKEFSEYVLTKLGIPILHFPQGNPFTERAWRELSWRMLFRHIYRQEAYWTDIADRQPPSELFAVLMQFLGIAKNLFPLELGEVVTRRKQLLMLRAKQEQFQEMIDGIASKMTTNGRVVQFVTSEVLNDRISELESKVKESLTQRQEMIRTALESELESIEFSPSEDVELSEERNRLAFELSRLNEEASELNKRRDDLARLLGSISEELEKLTRAKIAGSLLHDLKITHCPACDQIIDQKRVDQDRCFLCLQTISLAEGGDRLEFEIEQLTSEKKELLEIVSKLDGDAKGTASRQSEIKQRLTLIDRRLEPIRTTLGALVDPRLSLIDAERGRLEEQIENLGRLLSLLDYSKELSKEIDKLNDEIAQIDSALDTHAANLDMEEARNDLQNGIMRYLDEINRGNSNRWTKGSVHLHLTERNFSFKIHGNDWKGEVGATTGCYFLLAYQYSLLQLTVKARYNYPGVSIIDFPPSLPDGVLISTMENFLVEPFIGLCKAISNKTAQVIVAGRAFENLEGANRIELRSSWQ